MGLHEVRSASDRSSDHDFAQGELKFAWLEITQHCNLRCMHCYTSSSPARKHSLIDWAAIIHQVRDTGCRRLQFIGGEPLTHPDICKFVKLARKLEFEFVEVFTNAALLDDGMAHFLSDYRINVATSFYSTRAISHDAVTLTKGSFDQTLSGIRNAVANKLALRVGVIGAADDTESFDDKASFLEAMGIDRKMIGRDAVRPVGRGAKMTQYNSQFETLCGACWDGKLVVSYDGNCYPCIMSRDVIVGNVAESTVGEIVAERALNEFRIAYGAEVLNERVKRRSDKLLSMIDVDSRACTPDCTPSGPCTPMGCQPTADCNPYHCNPIEGCGPIKPNCGPNDGVCTPWQICPPDGGSSPGS